MRTDCTLSKPSHVAEEILEDVEHTKQPPGCEEYSFLGPASEHRSVHIRLPSIFSKQLSDPS
jgi:hypothetical protein